MAAAQTSRTDADCRYCSVVSKANGEDPIGTAVTADQWLFVEVPLPWAKNPWAGQPAELLRVFEDIEQRPRLWQALRIVAIAPDKTDSTSGYSHVFFYQKPQGAAVNYRQQSYHVLLSRLAALVKALVLQPEQLASFRADQQPASRHLFVCTHTRYDLACGRFGTPLYRTLRQRYAGSLKVWQTAHFGGHNFAPTLIDFPMGQFWGHLEEDVLDPLVSRQGDVTTLYPHYRGWSGFSRWAQIAEREMWMQQGWRWLTLPKTARILRHDPGKFHHRLLRWALPWIPNIRAKILLKKLEQKLTWAEVEIRWQDGDTTHRYCARVETSHRVTTQLKSGENVPQRTVPQFSVTPITAK
ncbi:MAG: sucrase ferredoxin [Cyanobacteria bacterium J06632_22]